MDVGKTDPRSRPELFLWPWAATTYSSMSAFSPSQFTSLNSHMSSGNQFNLSASNSTGSRMNLPSQSLNSILQDSSSNNEAVTSVAMVLANATSSSSNSHTNTNPIQDDPLRRSNNRNDISAATAALAALSDHHQQHQFISNDPGKNTNSRQAYLQTSSVDSPSSNENQTKNLSNPSTNPGTPNYIRNSLFNTDSQSPVDVKPSPENLLSSLIKNDQESQNNLHSIPIGSSNGSIPNHVNEYSKAYKCKLCFSVCYSKSDLAKHNAVNHNQDPRPHRCEQCGRQFSTCAYLSQHRRIHTGNKPYNCRFCERRFTQLSHQQQHERIHTGEKPYKCTHCSKAFTQMSNLQSHQRQHMKGKPHRCEHCFLSFDARNELDEHLQTKHAGNKYAKVLVCPYCSKSYNSETYLSKHVERHKEAGPTGIGFNFSRAKNQSIHNNTNSSSNTNNSNSLQLTGNLNPLDMTHSAASSLYLSMNGINGSTGTFDAYTAATRVNNGLIGDLPNQLQQSIMQNSSVSNHLNQLQTHQTDVQQFLANQTMLMKLEQQQQQFQRQQNQNRLFSSSSTNNTPSSSTTSPPTISSLNSSFVPANLSEPEGNNDSLMMGAYGNSYLHQQGHPDSSSFSQNGDRISPESIAAVARAFSFNSKINAKENQFPDSSNSTQKDSVQNFSRSLDMFLQATSNAVPILGDKSNIQQSSQITSPLNSQGFALTSRKRSVEADANNNSHDDLSLFNAQKLFCSNNANNEANQSENSDGRSLNGNRSASSTPNQIVGQSVFNNNNNRPDSSYDRASINDIFMNGRLDELFQRHQQNSASIL